VIYLLDSNVFISAKNSHYGMDFVPAFWDWLDAAHRSGLVFSVDAVRAELTGSKDDLASWAASRPGSFFLAPEAGSTPHLVSLSNWATSGQFQPAAVAEFLSAADYFLVGQARALGYALVTHERRDPLSKKRIKIPDACHALGVPCLDPWSMLRAEKARFVLPV